MLLQGMRKKLLAAVPLLIAVTAVGDEVSDSGSGPVAQKTVAINPYRFDVVSAEPVEHGERLTAVLGCIGCHTPDLTGDDWTEPELGVLWTANLTQSAATYSKEELTAMVSEGKRPDRALMEMPSYLFSELHPDDLSALVSYLKTLPAKGEKHPDPTIGPTLAKQIASGYFKDSAQQVAEMKDQAPPDLGPEHAFARYILRAACVECHGMDLQGSDEPLMDAPPRPGLQIVAAYSAEDFSTLMKTGKPLGDRELKLMGDVSRWRYSRFTDSEIEAVYNYLTDLAQRGP